MAEKHDLNPTDASNTDRFPENQAPSSLNNGARALEGMIARYYFDNDTSVVATISASLITVVANRNSLTLTGTTSNYVANFMQAFTMGANPNTGPVRVTIDAVGPIEIRDNRGASLSSSVLLAGTRCLIVKDGDNDYFRLIWPHNTAVEYNDPLTTRGDLVVRGASSTDRFGLGAANAYLANNGTDPVWRPMADQSVQETGSSLTEPVTPGAQHFHASALKCWADFACDAQASLVASYNVASVARSASGKFTVTIGTDFSSADYGAVVTGEATGSTFPHATIEARLAGSFDIQVTNENGGLLDGLFLHAAAFGDL